MKKPKIKWKHISAYVIIGVLLIVLAVLNFIPCDNEFKANGKKTAFLVNNKPDMIYSVTVNGKEMQKDVDFTYSSDSESENAYRVVFNVAPEKGSKINVSCPKGVRFGDEKASDANEYLLEKIAIACILAVSLNLVVGILGELSLGHAGFMCLGAYIGGKLSVLISENLGLGNGYLTLIISLVAGGTVAAVFGGIIGLPALRLKGDYLAIVTLAFGEIVRSLFMNSDTFGGTLGLDTPRFSSHKLFIIAFLLLLFTVMIIQNLIRSKHGRAITSIRDSEIASRATGINITKYKLIAFIISSFFAGLAGVLYSYSNFTVQSSKFSYNYSIDILVMVVLGGIGSIQGSIISAALITVIQEKLRTVLTGDNAVYQNMFYALILILIVIYNNAPALKVFREKYNLKAFISLFKKKKAVDPSDRTDDEAKWARVPTKIDMNEVLSTDVVVENPEFKPDKGGK